MASVADALKVTADTLYKVVNGRRSVTAGLAYSVARLTAVSLDDLRAGTLLSPRRCRHCGHPPDDFEEKKRSSRPGPRDDKPREAIRGGGGTAGAR